MPMTLIKGSFKILNAAPDGDSIRFYPHDPDLWKRLENKVRTNRSGGAQLRLDGIDAPETHYQPKGGSLGNLSQPAEYGDGAAAQLVDFLGFKNVKRKANAIVTAATPEAVDGYILTRFADKYGRSVAFAFKGDWDKADGNSVRFTPQHLKDSANYHLLRQGFAYPTYYSKLYVDIREAMTKAVVKARAEQLGLWAVEQSTSGVEIEDLKTITQDAVLLPKLFRRLVDYFALNDGSFDLSGFAAYLSARDDRLIILPEGQVTGFDFVVKVEDQLITLTVPPEKLVFLEA